MFIKQIVDFDKLSGEMELIISDGENELLCYCIQSDIESPLRIKEIETFLASNIILAYDNNCFIKKTEGYYSYHLQGMVLETVHPAIEIGKIRICIDVPFPKDIKQGDFVELFAERLDCRLY